MAAMMQQQVSLSKNAALLQRLEMRWMMKPLSEQGSRCWSQAVVSVPVLLSLLVSVPVLLSVLVLVLMLVLMLVPVLVWLLM